MGLIIRNKRVYGNNPNIQCVGGGGYAPVGTIIAFMGNNAPQDYLPCDGSIYFIADWPQLATFFENEFGIKNFFGGNGTTTFAVPDLQGEFLRGTGTNSHAYSGNGANVGAHQNGTSVPNYYFDSLNGNIGFPQNPNDNTNITPLWADLFHSYDKVVNNKGSWWNRGGTWTSSSDQRLWYSVRPTNTSVMFCIKAIADGTSFSTLEHYVGLWIDNKPLYQITLQGTTINSNEDVIATGLHNIDYCELVDFQVSNGTYRRNLLDSVAIKEDGSEIKMVADSESEFKDKSFSATILFTKLSD